MLQVENLDQAELVQRNYTFLLSAWPTLPRWGCLEVCAGLPGQIFVRMPEQTKRAGTSAWTLWRATPGST